MNMVFSDIHEPSNNTVRVLKLCMQRATLLAFSLKPYSNARPVNPQTKSDMYRVPCLRHSKLWIR